MSCMTSIDIDHILTEACCCHTAEDGEDACSTSSRPQQQPMPRSNHRLIANRRQTLALVPAALLALQTSDADAAEGAALPKL